MGLSQSRSAETEDAGPTLVPPYLADKWIHRVPEDQLGLRPLVEPEDAELDIIAVHGLGAIPDRTWIEKESQVHWLRDEEMLPAQFPRARILAFGYDSIYVSKTPVRTGVNEIADTLLSWLISLYEDRKFRPIIFIGHCFGGLVITRASDKCVLYHSILIRMQAIILAHFRELPFLSAIAGVLFLGTPHRGSSTFSDHGELLRAITVAAADTKNQLHVEFDVLDGLRSKRGNLVEGSEQFVELCIRLGLGVCCIFEQRSSDIGRLIGKAGPREFVVDEASAKLDSFPSLALPLDHFQLNKFNGPMNGNYQTICMKLKELYKKRMNRRTYDAKRAKSLLNPDENLCSPTSTSHLVAILPSQPCLYFVERPTYSQKLREFFKHSIQTRQMFVLWGMGGVGKTQIALHFAHSIKHQTSVFWIRADKFTSFVKDYVQILPALGVVSGADMNVANRKTFIALRQVAQELEKRSSGWLLVLDNADNMDEFLGRMSLEEPEKDISLYLPKQGRVLLTTRDKRFHGDLVSIHSGLQVKPMNDDESRKLLQQSIGVKASTQLEDEASQELLVELGNLPLAIAQAAANIRHLPLSITQYVVEYRDKQHQMELLQDDVVDSMSADPKSRRQSIFITFEISLKYLEAHAPASASLLYHMGCYHFRDIPHALLAQAPAFSRLSEVGFASIIKELINFSLVEETSISHDVKEYQIHPIVHGLLFHRLSERQKCQYLSLSVSVLSMAFPPTSTHEGLNPVCAYLLPHAVAMIDLGRSLQVKEKSMARLLQGLSSHLAIIGLTRMAVILSTEALHIAQEVWNPSEPSVFYVRMVKISCLIMDASYDEAMEELQIGSDYLQSAELLEEIEPQELQAQLGTLLTYQTQVLITSGRWQESEQLYRDYFDRRASNVRDAQYISIRRNLAVALKCSGIPGKIAEARQINDELLALVEGPTKQVCVSRTSRLSILRLKAEIMRCEMRLGGQHAQRADEVYELCSRIYHESLAPPAIEELNIWVAANSLLAAADESSRMNEAVELSIQVLQRAITSSLPIEGLSLDAFKISCSLVNLVIFKIARLGRTFVCEDPGNVVKRLEELIWDVITTKGVDPLLYVESPHVLNTLSVRKSDRGSFMKAERLSQSAVEAVNNDPGAEIQLKDAIHYNLMISIAGQEGRLHDAEIYRAEHREQIGRAEAQFGTLEVRVARWRSDKVTYNEAKRKLEAQELVFKDAWWAKNEAAMLRAENRYGRLEIPV